VSIHGTKAIEHVRPATLTASVVEALTDAVVRGDFPAGAPLPTEAALVAEFGVSRSVVREAIRQLATLGLVESHQGSRTRVAEADAWNHLAHEILDARMRAGTADDVLLHLLELRRALEVEAATLAAQRADDGDLARIAERLRWLDDHLDEDDIAAFVEGDLAFHDAILRATRNPLLPQLVDQLRPILATARTISVRSRPGGARQSQIEHRAISDAITAGDADAARATMTHHLDWTADLDLSARNQRLRRKT
jgi:DNA-binding FadR family transcriptional regulator